MSDGYLNNIFIHDSREIDSPSTLIAQKGKLINDGLSTKILLENGYKISVISKKNNKDIEKLITSLNE